MALASPITAIGSSGRSSSITPGSKFMHRPFGGDTESLAAGFDEDSTERRDNVALIAYMEKLGGEDMAFVPGRGLKKKLYNHWLDIHQKSSRSDFHSSKKMCFFSLCDNYKDILHCKKRPFYMKKGHEDSCVMDAYIMHSMNHILRSRDLIKKNDSQISKLLESSNDELLGGHSFLDHGFTRPKVLIILPFRNIAYRVIKRLIELTPPSNKAQVEYLDRFVDEFGFHEHENDLEDDHLTKKAKMLKSKKPLDHQCLFDGNADDKFAIGIKFARKSLKLFADFYSSDMIVASPLELHSKIYGKMISKDKDVDYLSSIEVLIIDHTDVISMQNFDFLTEVLEHLNCFPSNQHGTDIMRIRKWYLDGHARFYRQSIILSYHPTPDINALFNRQCVNYRGKVKLIGKYKGVLHNILSQVQQVYKRYEKSTDVDTDDDARFEFFTKKVYPTMNESSEGGIMLFASSYFEFIKLRNFLKHQNASFCAIADYTKQSDTSRARLWFFERRRRIILYTERAHFYRRYKIRGVQNLIIYSLPNRKDFYPEIVNMLEGASDNSSCTALFSQYDMLRLERIVGTEPAKRMVKSDRSIFLFC